MMTDDAYDTLIIQGDSRMISEMTTLLQNGFYLKATAGKNLREILIEIGFSNEFIDTSVKTVFLNSQPVDDIDRTRVSEGDVVGLSGSMPGLVGASLRSGSYLAALRRTISQEPEEPIEGHTKGLIRFKAFNVVLKETGEHFLKRGLFMKTTRLYGFLQERNRSFFEHCNKIVFNDNAVDFRSGNLNKIKFSSDLVFFQARRT